LGAGFGADDRRSQCGAWRVSGVRLPLEEVACCIAGVRTASGEAHHADCGVATLPFLAVQVRGDDRKDSAATPSEALDPSRTALRIVLPNGVVIHVAGNLDGERLGDVVIAAGQIPGKATAVASGATAASEVPAC
jgi:hypothetical protein